MASSPPAEMSESAQKDDEARKREQQKKSEKNMSEIDEHILKRFDVKKRLGKGAYGIVWKAVDRKSKEVVAVKKIFDAFRNRTDAQRTFREVIFLQAFRGHPNVVRLHSIHKAANNRDIYLGFEYMETDLHHVIRRGNILKDVHKRYIMHQMLNATKYIHSGNVIHRDQKPSNVLIDSACRVKLADFGLARSVSAAYGGGGERDGCADGCLTDYVATRWYRAPEILVASKSYTKGIDMWSLGCILGEMLTGKPLFPGSSTLNQLDKIMSALPTPSEADIAAVCSGYGASLMREQAGGGGGASPPLASLLSCAPRDAAELVRRLVVLNPTLRLSAADALRHEYVAKFHREKEEPRLAADVLLPLRDDRQMSVDDYRNKLYSLMARGQRAHQPQSRGLQPSKVASAPSTKVERSKQYASVTQQSKTKCQSVSADQRNRIIKTQKPLSTSHVTAASDHKLDRERPKAAETVKSEHALGNQRALLARKPVRLLAHAEGIARGDSHESRGDFPHPARRLSADAAYFGPRGEGEKRPGNARNSTSFSTVCVHSQEERCGGVDRRHGVITASALVDLRSSMR